tara:strand:- start:5970 stop:6776 length:807 start_codon:yes stop_codon:yes gene_type:complete
MFKYIAGNNRQKVLNYSKELLKNNKYPIINYILENNRNNKEKVYNEYSRLLENLDQSYKIALKLSSLNFDEKLLFKLIESYNKEGLSIVIDAEDNKNNERYNKLTNDLMLNYNNSNPTIIKTYQMYRTDSLKELCNNIKIMKNQNKILGTKLVRGAYYNTEKYDGHIFNKKEDTDKNYNNAIIECLKYNNSYNIIATHNQQSLDLASSLNKPNFSLAHLMGMNEQVMNKLKLNSKVYTYVPYGPYKEMIPYLTRRLYENIDTIKYMVI